MTMPRASATPKPSPAILESDVSDYEDGDSDGDDDGGIYHDLGGFKTPRTLPRHTENRYTLRDLVMLLDMPDGIDLNPVYQRDVVWDDSRQSGIIDSIFQNYYIPGLIFNKRVHTIFGIRKEILVCIDGKQRLTSVQRFTQGLIPCHDKKGSKWFFCQNPNSTRRRGNILPPLAQAYFWNKKYHCHVYVGMTEDQEHELFERVQRGKALTSAEKSQAKKGDWQQLARAFMDEFPHTYDLNDNRRGAGHNKYLSSFVQILEGDVALQKSRELEFRGTSYWTDRWFGDPMSVPAAVDHPLTTALSARMRRVFDRFEALVKQHGVFDTDYPKLNTLAPIEFIAIAYIIDRYLYKSDEEIITAVKTMRNDIRTTHASAVRRKPEVWDRLWAIARKSLGEATHVMGEPVSGEAALLSVTSTMGYDQGSLTTSAETMDPLREALASFERLPHPQSQSQAHTALMTPGTSKRPSSEISSPAGPGLTKRIKQEE